MLHGNRTVGLVELPLSSEILGPATLGAAWPDRRILEQNLLLAGAYNSGEDDDSEDEDDYDDDYAEEYEDEDDDEEKGDGKHPKPPAPPPEPKPPAPPPEPTPPSPQPEPTPPSPKPDPTPPAPRPVPNVPIQPDSRSGSRGGSWSGVKTFLDNPFEAYFENNVSGQNLAKIVVYFGLQDSFAAIQDDGHVDIVWLKFERKPSLKGINVVIDGTKRKPDFSATTGSLALLIFFDQATLTRRSDVFAAYGTVDVATAGKATHRPLR